jgi:hypothetical protein
MDIQSTCPLGSQCEEIKDNKLHRCAWYTKVIGKDPQSKKEIEEWRCAMSFMPMLMIEMSQTNRGQTSALESFRNEMIQASAQTNALSQASILLGNKHGI